MTEANVNRKGLGFLGIAYILLVVLYSGGGWLMPKPENRGDETKTRRFFRRWGRRLPLIGGMFVLSYYVGIHTKRSAELIFKHILKPIGKGISVAVKALGRGVKAVSLFTYNKILKPIGNSVVIVCNFSIQCILRTIKLAKNGINWTIEGYSSANAAYDSEGKKVEWYQDGSREVNVKKAMWYIAKTVFTAGGTLIFHAPKRFENSKYYLNSNENRKESRFREVCRKIANHVPLGGVFASIIYIPVLAGKKLHDCGWNSVETQNFLTKGCEFRITIHNKFIDFLNFSSEKNWRFKCWKREKIIKFREWRGEVSRNFREWRNGMIGRDYTEISTTGDKDHAIININNQPDNISEPIPKVHKDLYTQKGAVISIARAILGMLKDEHNSEVNKSTRRKHLVKSNENLRKNKIVLNAVSDDETINAVPNNLIIDNNKIDKFFSKKEGKLLEKIGDIVGDETLYKKAKETLKEIIGGRSKEGRSEIISIENIMDEMITR